MNRIKRLFNLRFSYVLGLLSFIFYSLSFMIGYEEESAGHIFLLLKAGLIFVSAGLFLISCRSDSSNRVKVSFFVLNAIILIYQLLLLLAVGKTIFYIRDYPAILNSLVWIVCAGFSIIRFWEPAKDYLLSIIKDKGMVILILSSLAMSAMVILLSAEPEGVRFTWDSDTLYGFIYGLDFESLYNAKLMTFHSHVSIVYAHLLVLFKLLFNDIRIAFFVLNALCVIAASFGMVFLLRELLPGRPVIKYILGGSVFAFSPWVCGLSTYHMYDYYIWCLFPLLICFYVRRNWVGFLVLGVMITFSKASGLIVFGSVCIGICIADIHTSAKSDKGSSVKQVISGLFSDIRYWFFASVAFVFFAFFKLGIAKETQFEDTRFGLDVSHILHILKMYTTANFLWLFMILTVGLIICAFIKKRINLPDGTKNVLQVVIISDFIFVLFNCLCITYKLPRYMNSHISAVYICAVVFLLCILSDWIFKVVSVSICVVSLVGCFKMIDPVSLLLFSTIDVGQRRIVDFERTEEPSFEDSIVCNREYYSYEIVLDKALTYVINNRSDSDEIMFSLGNEHLTWGLSGGRYSYDLSEGKHYFELFYDKTINGLANGYDYEYRNSVDMIPFETHYIFPQESVEDVIATSPIRSFYYLYMPTINEGREDIIYNSYNVSETREFEYRGWQMNCIVFSTN